MAQSKKKAPWKRPNPKKKKATHHLTPSEKATAKRRARKAGRPYPNLVDNMRAAGQKKAGKKKSAKKKSAKKKTVKKKAAKKK